MNFIIKYFIIFLTLFSFYKTDITYQNMDGNSNVDTSLSTTWGQHKIQLEDALKISIPTKTIKVGVIDSGIYSSHSKLNNIVNTTKGKDFVSNNQFNDEKGHGTHVAGIIGSIMNYSNIELYSYKVSNKSNLSNPNYVADAINQVQLDDCDIINISMSFMEQIYHGKEILQEAISNFDGLVVCSSSNFNKNYDNNKIDETRYPACLNLDNLITVGASNLNDERWICSTTEGSNYGKNYVDLFAPGDSIYSTYPTSLDSSNYCYLSGTSMATPFVTGVSALILSNYPSLTTKELKDTILNNVDKTNSLNNICKTSGRLNAYKALMSLKHIHSFSTSYNTLAHTFTCSCGYSYSQNHEIKVRYFDRISHKSMCYCGYSNGDKEAHVLKQSEISNGKGYCLGCGSLINLKTDISILEPSFDYTMITLNGSYKLSDGIIVLSEQDAVLYEQGLLNLHTEDNLLS